MPISLVISLSQTIKGLHWDKIPGDNDDEVAARGILYLLIFQQLGQLVRWSWGYHVLLAPAEKCEEETEYTQDQLEQGRYRDDPDETSTDTTVDDRAPKVSSMDGSTEFESGEQTPPNLRKSTASNSSKASVPLDGRDGVPSPPQLLATPANGNIKPRSADDDLTAFPSLTSTSPPEGEDEAVKPSKGIRGAALRCKQFLRRGITNVSNSVSKTSTTLFAKLPAWAQHALKTAYSLIMRFMRGLWAFMNPPLWAMLVAIVVASVPRLQYLFFHEGSFISNSVTRAISQSGGVAVPLILVVLGANLASKTVPESGDHNPDDETEDRKLLVASLISRMVLPMLIMAPLLALSAKYIPVSILDDPIFLIVCFLLAGAPSALQLAQICQINNVYMRTMSNILFQSYVVWYVGCPSAFLTFRLTAGRILPSTLVLVMGALEALEWAQR